MSSKDREQQLLKAAVDAGISSPKELANLMAQVTAESFGLNHLDEGFRYTKGIDQIKAVCRYANRHGPEELEQARMEALRGKPEHLAELMYGGRMGNDQAGDGLKYHGRGYVQLTGKENYTKAERALGLDLVKHPELAADPANAAKIAVWYWKTHVGTKAKEDVIGAMHAINGGENGKKDRVSAFEKWRHAVTPELVETIKAGKLGEPVHASVGHQTAAPHGMSPHLTAGRASVSSADVIDLQGALNHLGYTGKDGKPLETWSGQLGPNTDHAVREFQSAHGLKVDGIVGPKTQEALKHAKHHPLINEAGHPSHGMYEQIKAQTDKLGGAKALGFHSDKEYAQALANMTWQARTSGLTQVDHVVETANKQNLVMIQGGLSDPAQQREVANKAHAAQQPVTQSTQQLQQDVQQLQQQHHVQAQQQQVAHAR